MSNKRVLKFRYIANFSIFAGIVPIGISSIAISSIKNFTDVNRSNKSEFVGENTLKFGDKYISLRSNPMNNFVSLTTTKVGNGNIKEQFTYALCDTATSQEGIKYGKNSGIAKLDYNGNVVALWTLPKTGRGQENEYIYTTNIVFGDTEETVYVLCGISNPAAALNSVYGYSIVPTKINYDVNANLQDEDTAYFYRNDLVADRVFQRDATNNYKVDIDNYSFANYPKIKIYKLNANDLTQTAKYDFEFPPAATGKLNDPFTTNDEYGKIIVAGFGGGQHLNYWSTNSTWITSYKAKGDYKLISLMNSSFFHYLQFGQTFDYVGNEQFMMVPKYIGIDTNLGGLYSLVNEGMTYSLSSLSSYPSLYNVFYKYKGKPSVDINTKTIDFSINTVAPTSYQYQYLNGLGKKVNVTDDSEFALKESVINLILLSIGYFLPNHEWEVDTYGIDMEKADRKYAPGFMLNTYGIICFSPLENRIFNKYELYVFNKDSFFGTPVAHFVIEDMMVDKGDDGKKRYRFLMRSCFAGIDAYYPDFYNGDPNFILFLGTKNSSEDKMPLGFTWNEFVDAYDTIQNSQFNAIQQNIDLTGVNANSKSWVDRIANREYYSNLDSIFTVKNYVGNNNADKHPLGWYTDHGFAAHMYDDVLSATTIDSYDTGIVASKFSSSSGTKHINYGNKMLFSDVAWTNKLVVIDDKSNFSDSLRSSYNESYEYSKYANTAESYNRISTIFSFPDNVGFGYLTYNNELKVCSSSSQTLNNQLITNNFETLLLDNKLSHFCSAVPIGKMLFTSVLNKDKTISNKYFDISNGVKVNDDSIMWIIIGVCSAAAMFIALGLGIGIPVRKNVKLKHAIIKPLNKRINMLPTMVVRPFSRRLSGNTNTLIKNQPKILVATVPTRWPMGWQQPIRPIRLAGPIKLRTMWLQQPIRSVEHRPVGSVRR